MTVSTGLARPLAESEYLPIGRSKKARRAYGFDEVALVPGRVTVNPEEIDISAVIGGHQLDIPILASAMDGSVDVEFAIAMGRLGGLAVLNVDGVQTRYEDPRDVLQQIADAPPDHIKSQIVGKRVSFRIAAPIDQTILAMAGIGIEGDIGDDAQLREAAFQRPDGSGSEPVGIERFAGIGCPELVVHDRKQRDCRHP